MNPSSIPLELGVGGIFAVLVISMVFKFLEKRKNGSNENTQTQDILDVAYEIKSLIVDIKTKIDILHEWHSPDTNGEQTWKNKHMMELLKDLKTSVDANTQVLSRLLPLLERLERNT